MEVTVPAGGLVPLLLPSLAPASRLVPLISPFSCLVTLLLFPLPFGIAPFDLLSGLVAELVVVVTD